MERYIAASRLFHVTDTKPPLLCHESSGLWIL
jgi:hypothetical protein